MANFIKVLFSYVALTLCLTACGRAPIDQKQLVGKWALQKDFGRNNKTGVNFNTVFILRENGVFDAINLPRGIFFSEPLTASIVSNGSGTWKLIQSENGQQVIDLILRSGENIKGRLPYGIRLFVANTKDAIFLTYYHGDPDTDPRLDFVKEE